MILAKDAAVGEIYHSPKGIPCKIIEISDVEVQVRSLITSQDISIPLDLSLHQQDELIDNSNYSTKVVKKIEKQEKQIERKPKKKKERQDKTTVASVLREAMLHVNIGQATSYEEMTKVAQATFPEVSADKLFNRINMTIQGLKKQSVLFTRRKGQIVREK